MMIHTSMRGQVEAPLNPNSDWIAHNSPFTKERIIVIVHDCLKQPTKTHVQQSSNTTEYE